jgi:UDP-N-acetylmuramoyl-L-alanyl-D-glutamate--2,6-diaminopimelate ligase
MEINSFLAKMVEAGVSYCFMEVSSHGIDQHRIDGLHFEGGIFTNLTHDHLDYHKTFESYRDTKKKFFDKLPLTAFALSNHDDKNGNYMLQNCKAKQHSYALKNTAEFKVKILEHDFSGMQLRIDGKETWVALVGDFNASNMLAVYACTQILGENADQSLSALSAVEPVSGRFNVVSGGHPIRAIVDYAHTPDALHHVLETINKIRTGNEMLITVFGCGGDRDKAKRPLMGRIASTLSDKVIFTSDNPRNEDPEKIIEQIESGVPAEHFKKYISISSRLQAIKTACQLAHKGDIILVAGKGHETYQDIKGERLDFDDAKELKQHLQNKS